MCPTSSSRMALGNDGGIRTQGMGTSALVRKLDQYKQPVGMGDLGMAAKARAWYVVPQVAFSWISGTRHSKDVGS